MKKYLCGPLPLWYGTKISLTMKLTTLFLIVSLFQVQASSYGQQTKLTLNIENASVIQIFNEIESVSEFRFLYESNQIDVQRRTSLKVNKEKIFSILDALFESTNIDYKINGRQIILTPKKGSKVVLENVIGKKESDAPKDVLQHIISGTVHDDQGMPLPGASIVEKGTTNGTQTDFDGNFSIQIADGNAVLVISYIGFATKEIPVNGQSDISISLVEDAAGLEEVVVVGYGQQKKINLTGSVSTVTGATLTKRPVTNTASMLQGLLPGVNIVQSNGQPQEGGIDIKIRGQGTFSSAGSAPLVIIDGVPGSLSMLNPKTIESISVLKDAASASIYGSRAANGVIIVATKGGQETQGRLNIEYDYNYGVSTPTKLVDLVTNSADYMRAFNTNTINKNYGVPVPAQMYPEAEIAKYENPTDPNLYPSFDWQDFIINAAPTVTHNLAISGGGDKTRYNLSIGSSDQKGTMEAFRYRRQDLSLNISSDVSERLKVGGRILMKRGLTNSERTGQQNYYLTVLAQAPTYKPRTVDGEYYTWRAYEFESNNWNPYLKLREEFKVDDNFTSSAQLWSDFEILKGLRWNVNGAVRHTSNKSTDHVQSDLIERGYRDSSIEGYALSSFMNKTYSDELFINIYSTLNYEKSFNDHNITVLAGYSQEENNYEFLKGYRKGFASPLTPELDAASTDGQTSNGSSNTWAIRSWFGRAAYNYRDKYLVEGNLRSDGTSRLPNESRWGTFPSFSAAWRISEEDFMASTNGWLSNVKIRASWGMLGNQNIGLYPYQAFLDFTGAYSFDNTKLTQGVAPSSLNNRNIKWETTTTSNLGIDLTLFRNFSLGFDVYKKYTKDILRSAQATGVVGLSAPIINGGEMENVGFDLELSYRNQIKSGALSGMNIYGQVMVSSFKNKLVKFGASEDGGTVLREEGRPWNTFYLLEVDGIFQSTEEIANSPAQYGANTLPGMLKFRDVSGPDGIPDGVIDNNDRVPMEKGVFPTATYSFNLGADWKGFDVYGLFQGVAGSKTLINGWGFEPFVQGSAPTKKQLAHSWTPENKSNTMVMIGDPISYGRPSTYRLKDNSYLRLKTLQLGYTFPSELMHKLEMNSLRIYFAGDNLLTFTKYEGLDPERSGNGTFVAYPQNKVFSFGVNVKF